jgi:NAD(P)-dependent dehydrogenase (short-subunit alcohol dehydrogenase family)
VTSDEFRLPIPYWGVYATSKAALETLVKTYAGETRLSRVRANLLNPGPIRTRLRAQAMPGEDPETVRPPEAVVPDILRLLSPDFTRSGSVFDFSAAPAGI